MKYGDEASGLVQQTIKKVDKASRVGREIIAVTKSGSRVDAFKVAKDLVGDLGDNAISKSGKVKNQKGRIVGMQSADKTKGWRIDYDVNVGEAHFNWW